MNASRDYTVLSVKKALGLLKLFDNQTPELTLSEISQRSGIGKSSALRFLHTLVGEGFLSYDETTHKYSLGIELFRLGQSKFHSMNIRRIAARYLQDLANRTNLICYLGIREGDLLAMTDQFLPVSIPSWTQLMVSSGGTCELYSTGIGRLFLAQESDEDVMAYLKRRPLKRFTDCTVVEPQQLLALVQRARELQYASNAGENEPHVHSICVPVYGIDGAMIAGISISGLQEDVNKDGNLERIRNVALAISREMGYTGK